MKKITLIILAIIVLGASIFMIYQELKPKEKQNGIIDKKPEPKLQIIDMDSDTRNIAVMINNHSVARPLQSGLNDAYIVYEIMVEGGITRLMAIYKDQVTTRIGPVRSSRHYYLDYTMENDAIYVHFGWSDFAKNDISTYKINNLNGLSESAGFWRDTTLKVATEHTAFTSMSRINTMIDKHNYRDTTTTSPLLKYSIPNVDMSLKVGAIAANKVIIEYSNSSVTSYIYDSITKLYTRYFNNIKYTDYVTKEAHTTKNIIVYKVVYSTIDSYGRKNIANVGSGEGYYIGNGYAVPITWTKDTRASKTIYKYLDGQEILVNDGNTYIQIMPSNKDLTISAS